MRLSSSPLGVAALAAGLWLSSADAAVAQHWPTEPVTFAGGRLLIGGDASVTFGSDDPGWFTYTDYETSAIRRVRAGATIEVRATDRIAFLTEIRAETGAGVTPYAWYVRVSPLANGLARHPGRAHSSGVRDVCAPQLPPGQPAHRIAPDLPVPHLRPPGRGTGDCGRPAEDEGPRLARHVSGGEHGAAQWRADDCGRAMGHRRADPGWSPGVSKEPCRTPWGRSRTRGSATTTAADRSPAAWRGIRSPPSPSACRRRAASSSPTTCARRGLTRRPATTISAPFGIDAETSWGRWLFAASIVANAWSAAAARRSPHRRPARLARRLRGGQGPPASAPVCGAAGRRDTVHDHRGLGRRRNVGRGRLARRVWRGLSRFAGACW